MILRRPARVFLRRCCIGFVLALCVSVAGAAPSRGEARAQLRQSGIAATTVRLVQYAAEGDTVTVELLLAAGVSPNAAEPLRRVTPLHNAAAQGHARLVTRFLELGADVNALDWLGYPPLVNAAYYGRAAVVQQLLAAGARVDIKPVEGPTALIAAVQANSPEIVDALLVAGADPALADSAGQTPLAAAELAGRTAIAARLATALAGGAR